MRQRPNSVEKAGTDPAKLARAIGIGERAPSRVKARGLFGRFAAWRRERRERRWEEMASRDGRAAQLQFESHRTFGETGSIGGASGLGDSGGHS